MLPQYPCPGCQTSIAAPFLHSGMHAVCPECRWNDIQAIVLAHATASPYLENNTMFIARRSGDGTFVDAALHSNSDVVAALQERSLSFLIPDYRETISSGQRISFVDYGPGPVRDEPTFHVTPDGLEFGDQQNPRDEVKDVKLRRDKLTITRQSDKKISCNNPLTIPNLHVLVAMIQERAGA